MGVPKLLMVPEFTMAVHIPGGRSPHAITMCSILLLNERSIRATIMCSILLLNDRDMGIVLHGPAWDAASLYSPNDGLKCIRQEASQIIMRKWIDVLQPLAVAR